jgi:hypothetical protein
VIVPAKHHILKLQPYPHHKHHKHHKLQLVRFYVIQIAVHVPVRRLMLVNVEFAVKVPMPAKMPPFTVIMMAIHVL